MFISVLETIQYLYCVPCLGSRCHFKPFWFFHSWNQSLNFMIQQFLLSWSNYLCLWYFCSDVFQNFTDIFRFLIQFSTINLLRLQIMSLPFSCSLAFILSWIVIYVPVISPLVLLSSSKPSTSFIEQAITVPISWFIRNFTTAFCYEINFIYGNCIFTVSSATVFPYPSLNSFDLYFC